MSIVDAAQRATAIDPTNSFCVSAPAGSGKTELLIQRYLGLLSRVERPEQVLAITFTRKAAAEMRERVVQALAAAQRGDPCDSPHQQTTRELAGRALAADSRRQWRLQRDVSRLNIRTIDSFCGGLTRQMPVLSEFGGQARLLDDAGELYTRAVASLFARVDSDHRIARDLAALMLHFDNNWERLQSLLVSMLARRDQWRDYVGVHHAPEESQAYLLASVEAVVCAELSNLADRLAPYAAALQDLMCYAAENLDSEPAESFPGDGPGDVGAWRSLRNMLQTNTGSWRKTINKNQGFPAGKGEQQRRKAELMELIGELAGLEGVESALAGIRYLPEISGDGAGWELLVHLSRLLPVLAAELLLVFQQQGAVDHCQVALSALQALGEDQAPTELALRLDYAIEHILVDEFQDTAINQYELIRCLTRGWGQHNATNPEQPRTVMIVGDGMQSIYGFRGANVGLFLKARQEGFNGVRLQHLELLSNFRSDQGVVDWVNETFTWAFPRTDDINRGQVRYTPAVAVRPTGAEPAVVMHAFHGEEARAQEAEFICAQIAAASADPGCTSVAVLGRSRGHLQPIIEGLKHRGIACSAQDLDSLAESPVVADLMNLCRALANRADRLAWMALLRAPWCGLTLADLLLIGSSGDFPRFTPVWPLLNEPSLLHALSADGRARVGHLRCVLDRALSNRDRLALRVWVEQAWLALGGPACAGRDSQLADAETFMQLLEQAERDGVGLDILWLEQQLAKRYVSGGDPAGKVQLMTLHKAKGLEFDRVIIPQLARAPRSDGRQLLLWDEHSTADGQRRFLLAADDHSEAGQPTLYNYLQQQRQEKALLEGTRLLYVGATRAIGQLVLTASLNLDETSGEFKAPAERCLLSPIWRTFSEQMIVHEPPASPSAAPPSVRDGTLLRRRSPHPPARIASPADQQPAGDLNMPQRADNHLERSIGTVVHLALEELSLRDTLPATPEPRDLARWRLALQGEGLWGDLLEEALGRVEESVSRSLASEEGLWVLSSQHAEARSEWCLSTVTPQGDVRQMVIDRTFVDAASGYRWLIDYKNSRPERGESLAAFCARESATYRPQLEDYRGLLRQLDGRALRCALFFTALGQLHHLTELDLPATVE